MSPSASRKGVSVGPSAITCISAKDFFKLLAYFVDAIGFSHYAAEAMFGIVNHAGVIGVSA